MKVLRRRSDIFVFKLRSQLIILGDDGFPKCCKKISKSYIFQENWISEFLERGIIIEKEKLLTKLNELRILKICLAFHP